MKPSNIVQYLSGYIASKQFTSPPVIIGGCERSGTSLLQSIISAHHEIFAIEDETWSFCYGPAAGFKGNKPIRKLRLYKALGISNIPKQCTRWSEKSPANIFYFDAILNHFSNNVRLIHIVRDGRDVITSMHPDNPSKPWVSVERWVQAVEKGYRYRELPQVLTIKYEDLITDFTNTVKLICEHIGVEVDEQILDWHKHAAIKRNKNLIGNTVKKLSNKSIRKFESDDFRHKNLIDEFMANDKAVYFINKYKYM